MLLELTQWLAQDIRAFGVFNYLTLRAVLACAVVALLAVAGCARGGLAAGEVFRDCPGCPDLVVVPAHDSTVQDALGYFPAWVR